MREIPLPSRSASGFAELVSRSDLRRYRAAVKATRKLLRGHTLWHVNSTSEGGGVAELLRSLLGYLVHDGIDTRWLVVDGNPAFFDITKRIHNRLHGSPGDDGPLDEPERLAYDAALTPNLAAMRARVRPGDVVVLHDPQTVGLARSLRELGVHVIWVCHVGIDDPNDLTRSAWAFLADDVAAASATVFSRRRYIWDGVTDGQIRIIPPCIDPASPKNTPIEPPARNAVLAAAGLAELPAGDPSVPVPFDDVVRVARRAAMMEDAPVPATAPLVVQVSRWDRLKDPVGVLRGFVERVPLDLGAHLMLAGPAADSVADDPEGLQVLEEVRDARARAPRVARSRVHLASLPAQDLVENAVIVNALQRFAAVVVQKSLAEGFGLTVTEAMWKERPVVASRVGGIRDQITDELSGVLVAPTDLDAYGDAVSVLLRDELRAVEMGHAARSRVRERFLPPHFLAAHLELTAEVVEAR